MKYIPSFIKIGGAVSEKNGNTRHTFVVLYIGWKIKLKYLVKVTNCYLFEKVDDFRESQCNKFPASVNCTLHNAHPYLT